MPESPLNVVERVADSLAVIRLNRPERLNALRSDAAIELENRAPVLALLTDDFAEASAAFAEKRSPRFTGR